MIIGVTSLAGEIYVLRWKGRGEIEVYDVTTCQFQRQLVVPEANRLTDMTSCEHNRCTYISDYNLQAVHRIDVRGAATRWDVKDPPWSLSVNSAHNVLVTCPPVRKIKEFRSDGEPVREVLLPADVMDPSHAVQLNTGQFVVCHGRDDASVRRVCLVSEDGRQTVRSFDGKPDTVPRRLAVDSHGFVFVADIGNNPRVALLNPELELVRDVVTIGPNQLNGQPRRLCVDLQRRLLYVADVVFENGAFTAGLIVVFRI